ncbi:MAG: sialidase family protein [Armatimonadota bacterium]|nr:glycoside hydrolase [Armatimonadota bacterium]MDW8026283.1 sialidase family protein [Armatimonadota bacterium]
MLAYTKGLPNYNAHTVVRKSTDHGKTWGPEFVLLRRGRYAGVGKPEFSRINSKKISMVYTAWTNNTTRRAFRWTVDDGVTRSDEVIIADGFYGRNSSGCVGNGGRLISVLCKAAPPNQHALYVTYSDNEGISWTAPTLISGKALGEAAAAYIGENTVLIIARSKIAAEPFYHLFRSTDNGMTFTEELRTCATWCGSDNPPELTVIPGTRTVLAVVNGYKTSATVVEKDQRSSGVVISPNGGESWTEFKLIDYINPPSASQQLNFAVLWKGGDLFFFTGRDGSFHPQGANGEATEMKYLAMKIIPKNQLTGPVVPYEKRANLILRKGVLGSLKW